MTTILELLRNKYEGFHVKGEMETHIGMVTLFDGVVNHVNYTTNEEWDRNSLVFVISGYEYFLDIEKCLITIKNENEKS